MISVRFTGLDRLTQKMKSAPDFIEKELYFALGRSMLAAQGEAQKRTPLDTGLLKSSIGGAQGYSFVKGFTAGVGTNIKYAIYVEENDRARHTTGEAHFMEKGAKAAVPFIQAEIEKLAGKLATHITT